MAQGVAQGVVRGEALALLQVLDERGLAVDSATRELILACTDAAQLSRWLRRAVHATALTDLFDA